VETSSALGNDPDSLLRRIKNDIDGAASNGKALNDLLEEFHRGYPTKKLIELSRSSNPSVVRSAAWLLSELGTAACAQSSHFWRLLESTDPKIRFSLIDCVTVCAGDSDGDVIVKLIDSLLDASSAVRWKALDALVKLSERQLDAGWTWLKKNRPNCPYSDSVKLLSCAAAPAVRHEVEQLESGVRVSEMERKLIVASGIRANLPLERLRAVAATLGDDDLQDFLEDFE
jgi:hypothetical protein